MTIAELLDRVLPDGPKYDPKFARKFVNLMNRIREDRDRLNQQWDRRVAERLLRSWGKVLEYFANDPRSLAALTVPKLRKPKVCKKTLAYIFPKTACDSPTTIEGFYFRDTYQTKSKKSRTSGKAKVRNKQNRNDE